MKLAFASAIIALLAPATATAQGSFGTLVVIEAGPVPSGPSPLSAQTPAEWRFVELVYAPLFSLNAMGTPAPYLAEKVEVQDGGKRIVVSLKDAAKWSIGKDVGPLDVVYTYRLAKEGKWNNAWVDLLRPLKSVERASNGFDIVFELAVPMARPEALLTVPIIPSGLHGPLDAPDRQRPLPLGAIGAGPYKPASEQNNWQLVVNEHALRKPRISEIRFLSAGSRRLAADYVRLMGDAVTFDVAPEDAALLEGEFGAKVIMTDRKRLVGLAFDPKASALGDPIVRSAFEHLIRRSELFVTGESARSGAAPVGRRSSEYPRTFKAPAFDPVEAERMLWWKGGWQREPHQPWFVRTKDNGSTEELAFSILVDTDDRPSMRRAFVLRERARRAGVKLRLDPRPRLEFDSRVRSREFPAALVSLDLPTNGSLRPLFHSEGGDNVLKYKDADVDNALNVGNTKRAAALLAEKRPMLFLGITRDVGVAGRNVTIPGLAGRGGMERVHKWRIR